MFQLQLDEKTRQKLGLLILWTSSCLLEFLIVAFSVQSETFSQAPAGEVSLCCNCIASCGCVPPVVGWEYAEGSWVKLLSDLWQIQLLLPRACDLDAFRGSKPLGPWSSACCRLFATVFKQTRRFWNWKSLGKIFFSAAFQCSYQGAFM